ncbi:MAG: threonine aldolase family protein [Gemmatimonadales bacterium]
MDPLTRRDFVGVLGTSAAVNWAPHWSPEAPGAGASPGPVVMFGDGLNLTPSEYAALLARLTGTTAIAADSYLLGGEVERFERRWAQVLGKETAVFMPSGTLANQLALRALAGDRRRIIVPEASHVYNDTGDACQTLSGLSLLPLGPGQATFTVADVEATLARTASGRVAAEVGAILIESPIRRLRGQLFDVDEVRRIATVARAKGIGLHLDGARLFIASAYTGIAPADYAAPFDTVYVSLWKYFNCGIGAILAGPKRVIDGMHHVRRMFGGSLAHGWPAAVVASHYMDGFVDRLRTAVRASEEFFSAIGRHPGLVVERVNGGTNVATLKLAGRDWSAVAPRLLAAGILVADGPGGDRLGVGVNETWSRLAPTELASRFLEALR